MTLQRDPTQQHSVSIRERHRRLPAPLFVLALLLVLAAYAPWLGDETAAQRAEAAFAASWQGVADGCGFNCEGCGAVAVRRVAFGAQVTLEYACGLLPADLPEYHQQADVFYSFAGTLHNLPAP